MLVNTRYRPPNFRGGVERYVHVVATELLRANISCEVVALAEDVACDTPVPHRFVRVPRIPLLRSLLFGFLARTLWQHSRVVVVQYTPFGIFVPKRKLVCTVHTTAYGERVALAGLTGLKVSLKRARRFISVPMERFVLRRARRVIAISEAVAQELRDVYGVGEENIAIVGNGVDCAEFAPSAEAKGHSPLRVLYVGRLVKRKNVDLLIGAAAAVRSPLAIRVVGSGPEENALRDQAKRLEATAKIEFRGFRTGPDLLAEYHWADVFAIPSSYEGVPLAALEAKATGLPVVASCFAGAERLVTIDSGLVVGKSKSEEFASAFDWLAENPIALRKMAHCARAEAQERFSWTASARQLIHIYESVAQEQMG